MHNCPILDGVHLSWMDERYTTKIAENGFLGMVEDIKDINVLKSWAKMQHEDIDVHLKQREMEDFYKNIMNLKKSKVDSLRELRAP